MMLILLYSLYHSKRYAGRLLGGLDKIQAGYNLAPLAESPGAFTLSYQIADGISS